MISRKDSQHASSSNIPMLDKLVEGPRAWRRETISREDWFVPIPSACLAEIEAMLEALRRDPLPTFLLSPKEFGLSACAGLMEEVKRRLDQQWGVVVLHRLPVEDWSEEEAWGVFWLLGNLLGRPVSQSVAGEVKVSVRDTGIPKAIGVRGFRTNVAQAPHIDNSFNHCPPDYVSLLGLRGALAGGESHFISFYTVHNELLKHAPQLLERLYRPFYQDRQGDFRPGESQTVEYPVFAYDGELRSRYTHFTIPAGYQTAGLPFEGESKAAFDAISELVDDPSMYCAFTIEPGHLQFVNNRGFGHGRTGYKDADDPEQRRHLLRLWHRDWGARSYHG